MGIYDQDRTVVIAPRRDLQEYSMQDLFANYGQGDGTELRQGKYFRGSGQTDREKWADYQAILAEEQRREDNRRVNERVFDLADKGMSPLKMVTEAAEIDDPAINTAAELLGPGEAIKGTKMLVVGAAGADWLKKFLMGKAKKPRPNAFNTPELRRMPEAADVKPTLDDIRPYTPKEKPVITIPDEKVDEVNLFDDDAIELRPYSPSQQWQKKQKREGLLRELDDVQQKGKQLDEYQTRIDRAIRMLERKKMEAAEDAIELRPYTPKKKD